MAKLSESDVQQRLGQVGQWKRDGAAIRREFKFKDFVGSMGFVTKVALLAEKADHHPDIAIGYNRVTLALSTHSDGGLTAKDFDLAQQIDAVV